MTKVRCTHYGYCPLLIDDADEWHEFDSLEAMACPNRESGEECGAIEEKKGGGTNLGLGSILSSPAVKFGAAGLLGFALIGALVWAIWSWFGGSSADCDIEDVQNLMELAPKVSELEISGSDCLDAGLASGDVNQLVAATTLLRAAVDGGSSPAAYTLGRLFDPIKRPDLESETEFTDLLPATDATEAVRFYDLAGPENAEAVSAAQALRARYQRLSKTQISDDGAPLDLPEHDGLARRVLAKPGAQMFAQASESGTGRPLAAMSLHYVFETKLDWLKIGSNFDGSASGWVRESDVEPWNVMLVFEYLSREYRRPALFFNDELAARSVVSAVDRAGMVDSLLASTDGGSVDPRLVAVEEEAVDWSTSEYLMPILKTERVSTDGGRPIILAQVASVAGSSAGMESLSDTMGIGQGGYCNRVSTEDAVHQIVFVIDTTASMGSYIDGVKAISERWVREIRSRGIDDKFRFGVVGYRNNMDEEPQRSGLEYVTRKPLTLSATASVDAFAEAVRQLQPSTVSTHSFNEDALAGLDEAIRMDWSQGCGAKMIFLITDAGSLESDDPKTRVQGTGLSTLNALAQSRDIDIWPVHIHTPEARRANNIDQAATLYRSALQDGTGVSLYRAIPDGSRAGFDDYLSQVSTILDVIEEESKGTTISAERAASLRDKGEMSVSDLVLGKLFAAQMRYVGAAANVTAPTFTSSWTSDRDLANPDLAAFEVKVYLTRRQLGQLAEKCQRLINNANATESAQFFNMLRMVAAATSQDPARFDAANLQIGSLMPSFLTLLPYKSEVLSLSEDEWRSMGASDQNSLVNGLMEKVSYYRRREIDQTKWKSLGSSDPNEQVTLVPLDMLP